MNDRKFALVRISPAAIVKHEAAEEQVPEVMPRADILETSDAFIVTLDLPGATKESIRLEVGAGELSVSAAVHRHAMKNAAVVYSEIARKQYRRQFRLGGGVDQEHIDAQYVDGVLTMTLPKTDALKKREIVIH